MWLETRATRSGPRTTRKTRIGPARERTGFQLREGSHTRCALPYASSDFDVFQIVAGRDPGRPAQGRVIEVDPGARCGAVGQHDVGERARVKAAIGIVGSIP